MTLAERDTVDTPLTLLDELVLTLLNEESGYFRQVPGWNLNCAVVGAALAELSLTYRIDTDMESLIILDQTRTGAPPASIRSSPRLRQSQVGTTPSTGSSGLLPTRKRSSMRRWTAWST